MIKVFVTIQYTPSTKARATQEDIRVGQYVCPGSMLRGDLMGNPRLVTRVSAKRYHYLPVNAAGATKPGARETFGDLSDIRAVADTFDGISRCYGISERCRTSIKEATKFCYDVALDEFAALVEGRDGPTRHL